MLSNVSDSSSRFRVLIAGGGVAGLEAVLALRDLLGDRVAVTVLTPERDFVYRPMAVGARLVAGMLSATGSQTSPGNWARGLSSIVCNGWTTRPGPS